MNKLLKVITSRIFLTAALILLQLGLLFTLIVGFSIDRQWVYVTFSIIAILLILYVVNMNSIDISYKLAWIMVLTCIPIVGPVLYIIFANKKIPKALRLDTQKDETSQLFLKSLELGLKSIQKQYGSKYLKILYKEV